MYRRLRHAGWRLLGIPSEVSSEEGGKLVPPDLVREVLKSSGRFRMVALGGSMAPAILHGQELLFEPATLREVSVGDVALVYYASQSRYCIHRVVGRAGGVVLTKGDSLDVLDEPVGGADLLARLAAVVHRRGAVDLGRPHQRLVAATLARLSLLSVVVATAISRGRASLVLARALRVPGFILAYLVYRVPARLR
jgi:hypothetical protein